jgi:hypothetical protein
MDILAIRHQALQFDRLHLAAVLFALRPPLGLLFVVQFPADPVGGAVEDVDGRPEEIVEVWFEARVLQGADQGVEDAGDIARDLVAIGRGGWSGGRAPGAQAQGSMARENVSLHRRIGQTTPACVVTVLAAWALEIRVNAGRSVQYQRQGLDVSFGTE